MKCVSIFLCLFLALPLHAATYNVTVTQPSHGTISPSGVVSVTHGVPCTFTITPDPGYTVADVITAYVSHGPMTSFTYYGILYDTPLTAVMIPTPNSTPETIYVDNSIALDCTSGNYSVANRNGSGSDGNAYTTIGKACYVAGPGDTIYVRAGTYHTFWPPASRPGDVLWPRVSGTAENPILFKAYNGETVIIGDEGDGSLPSDYQWSIRGAAISMRNVSYITIDGFIIRSVSAWLFGRDCSHITIQNCKFRDSLGESRGIARLFYCSYCAFRNCSFKNSSYDSMVLVMSDHIVVEDCVFDKAVHSLLSLRSASWCVIRDNTFRNGWYSNGNAEKLTEVFDQKVNTSDPLGPTYTPVPGYNATQHNLFENNFFGYHPDYDPSLGKGSRTSAIQFSGQKTIIRKNVFSNPVLASPDPNGSVAGGVGIVWRWGGSWDGWNESKQQIIGEGIEAGFVWGNRVYNNTFYGYDGSKMTFPVNTSVNNLPNPPPMKNVANYTDYLFTDTYRFDDNIIVNNVLTGGAIVAHIDWTHITMCKGMPVQTFIMGRRPQTFWRYNDFYADESEPNHDKLIMDYVDYGYQQPKTPAYMNENQSTNFIGNVQLDPCFVDLSASNFHLQSPSALIDAGGFLTTITLPAGSGTQITVADPNYFYDGYGISGEQGDLVELGNGQIARITSINYTNGNITLDRAVSWGNGEKVSLDYDGSAPDIGAHEYVVSAVTDLSVSGTSQNSVTMAWTVPGEEGVTGKPTRYDIRYADAPLTDANWATAIQVQGEPVPGDFGEEQSFTITGLNPGTTYYVAIKTADEVGHTSQLSNIASGTTATSGNHAPVLESIGDRSVVENEILTFEVNAADADGDALSYSATHIPTGASFDPATRTFAWTPTNTQSGTYRVTFQVTDGQVAVSETITITVRETSNQTPVLAAIGNKGVNENALLSFSVSATDPDGDALTYSATGLPNGANFANRVFSWTPTYDEAGSYSVTFSVSDGELTDTEKITITVANVTDQTAPSAHDFYPAAEAIQAPLNPLITLTISDGGWGVDANTVTLHVNDQPVYSGNSAVYESAYGVCRRTGTPASYRYHYHPADLFDFDQQVSVRVNASDMAHNAMTPVSYQFVTVMRSFGRNQLVSASNARTGHPAVATDSQGSIWAVWHAGQIGARDIWVAKRSNQTQQWDAPVRLTNISSDHCNPCMAIGSDGALYITWQDNRRGNWDIYVSISLDGDTWQDPVRITDSDDNQTNPVIAVDRASPNRVYIAWEDDSAGNQDIYIASSDTLFASKTITQVTSDTASQTEPALAVSSDNTVYLVWTDQRNGSADIYGSSSGTLFSDNVAIVIGSGDQQNPAIAVEPGTSQLHVLWVDDTPGNLDIFYGAADGLPAGPISGSTIVDDTTGADQSAPAIVTARDHWNNGHVFACWQDNRSAGDSDLYFAEIRSGESGTNILVGDDEVNSDQSEPSLGFDKHGQPAVLWADDRAKTTRIYGACSIYFKPVALASGVVTSTAGGRVGEDPASIDDDNDVSIEILPNAYDCDIVVSISEIQNLQKFRSPCVAGYEIGPSGIQFSLPATVTIPYTSSGSGRATPYWYNALTDTLSQQGITKTTRRTLPNGLSVVSFNTTHLTTFCVLERTTGGGGGGGCALAHSHEASVAEFFLPCGALVLFMLTLKRRDRRCKGG